MSTDSKEGFIPNSTHGEFWEGYMLDWMPYWVLVVFGGFLGLDKLALRSPATAFLKFVVNLFFFGAWWIYDILQLFDRDFVAKYGHTSPFGVSGHGYRMIHNLTKDKTDEYTKPSTYNRGIVTTIGFIAYVLTSVFLGFTGLPNLIAGDTSTFFIKLFSNFAFGIPTIFYILTPLITIWAAGSLGKDNVPHEFPLYKWFTIYKDYPAYFLISKEAGKVKQALFEKAYDLSGEKPLHPETAEQPYLISGPKSFGTAIYDFVLQVWPAAKAVDSATKLADASTATVEATGKLATAAAGAGTAIASAIEDNPKGFLQGYFGKKPVSSTPPPTAVSPNDASFSVVNPMKQKGGSLMEITPELDKVLLLSMGILIMGGFAAAALRKFSSPKREEEDEYPRKTYERDDSPPNPGRV